MTQSKHLTWHQASVTKADRCSQNGHGSCVLWFTGLSGSGKSTIANALSRYLHRKGISEYVLDGDNIRHGLNRDLGFSDSDRKENIRRIGEVAKLFADGGTIVISAFISPFCEDRDAVRAMFEPGEFIEVHIHCPLDECERRDPKQLYQKARKGELKEFTGIDSPYEKPINPEITIYTEKLTVEEAVYQIRQYLIDEKII
ncbi:adenylyl-sulfate kinase [Bacillus sp. 1P06AnD]|uniref:adenylyl-sulfate kinase n=1 Tax=Bacillus sp. 1P06AnD TaxID=3132208 RepID=UPI0039A3A2A4